MARREVLMIGNPKLREESSSVTNFDNQLKEVVQDLKDTLFHVENGKEVVKEFNDELSELFQHEIDHLYGKLATDYLVDNKNIIMRSEWKKRYK